MESMSDEELMDRFCAGNTAAFQVLFDKYKNRVFRFVIGVHGPDTARAEDIAQETFLRVIRNRDRFNPGMRFTTWLYTIARNVSLNEIRKRPRDPVQAACPPDVTVPDDRHPDAARALAATELGDAIRAAVAALPEPLRTVFVMREVEGLSYGQIADVTGRREGAVRTQLHRAKQQLKQTLTLYLDDSHDN